MHGPTRSGVRAAVSELTKTKTKSRIEKEDILNLIQSVESGREYEGNMKLSLIIVYNLYNNNRLTIFNITSRFPLKRR